MVERTAVLALGYAGVAAQRLAETVRAPADLSFLEPLADSQPFAPARRAGFWISHVKFFERIEDDTGNN